MSQLDALHEDLQALLREMRVLIWQSRLTRGGIVGLVLYALKQAFGW